METSPKWKDINKERKEKVKAWKATKILKQLEKAKKSEEKTKTVKDDEIIKSLSTISIALPGSILDNAQSAELRTYVAGQIARAACIFNIDEIIVFDDGSKRTTKKVKISKIETEDGIKDSPQCCIQLARILQYLECPQYLRKFFFPIHKDLKFSGLLNPLDAPHHLRQYNEFEYREGVVINKLSKDNNSSFVNIGLLNDCKVNTTLPAGLRVTVQLKPNQDLKSKKLKGTVVSPSKPRLETGIYWGYNVRIAESLTQVFSQSPYKNGYDLTIGTSDKASSVHDIEKASLNYQHALIVFGGLQGLESAFETDNKIEVDDISLLFNQYINVVPAQGSRTIRTEEAILIALASLEEKFNPLIKPKEFNFTECIPQSSETGIKQVEIIKHKKRKINDIVEFENCATSSTGENDLTRFD